MGELLNFLQRIMSVDIAPWWPVLKWSGVVLIGVVILVALGLVTYILRTTLGPFVRVAQWLSWYTPGQRPHPVLLGISHGIRLVIWATVLGLGLWFAISSLGG
jgi:hypothetical protein